MARQLKDATHLVKRGAVYYFRARVPTALQSEYGRKVIVVSLQTRDRAEAKARVVERTAELEREYRRLRGRVAVEIAPGKRSFLSDTDLDRICAYHRARILEGDLTERMAGLTADSSEIAGDIYSSWMDTIGPALARGDTSVTSESLKRTLGDLGIEVLSDTPSYRELEYRYLAAEVEAFRDVMRRQRGEFVATPAPPKPRMPLDSIVRCWEKQTEPRDATLADFEQVFRRFRELHPALSADEVTKKHVVAYRDHLVELNRAPKTVQRHLNHLHAAFQVAADSELIPFNPASGVKPTQSRKRKGKSRLPFNIDELNKIFFSRVFTKQARPIGGGGEAAYWLPLLGLWTGARLEELAQLEPGDIREDREQGAYIDINDEGKKRLKNASSMRRVPIHNELARLGFMNYVRSQRRAQSEYLFPDLKPDIKGNRSGNFSKWFARYLDSVGIADRRKVYHSFRHGFVDACRECMNPELRDALVGHANKSVSEQYGSGRYPLPPLVDAMNRVGYKGLSLTHLHRERVKQR